MKILIGTGNESKIKKYGTILNELNIDYCTPKDLNLDIEINENGKTPKENSELKAKAFYEAVKMPVLVDDSGLLIDGLPEDMQPGVFVRRLNGKRLSDEEWIENYSKLIEKLGGKAKGAFVISISIVDNEGNLHTNVVRHERLFLSKPCKTRNAGYPANSLIFDKQTGKYLAEEYEGKKIYKGNSFEKDLEFIKSVLVK